MKSVTRPNRAITRRGAAVLLGAGLLASPALAPAATFTWNGGDPIFGFVNENDNWVGGASPYSATSGTADLVFASTNPHGYSPTLSGNLDAHSLTFNTSALSYNLTTNGSGNSGTLTLESAGLTDNATNAETISGTSPVVLNASQTWNVAGGAFTDSTPLNLSNSVMTLNTSVATGSATLSGVLTGNTSSGITKNGPGTFNLSLPVTASSVGVISLQAGLTQLNSGTLNSLTTGLGVSSGATLNVSGGILNAASPATVDIALYGGTVTVNGSGSQLNAPVSGAQIDVGVTSPASLAVTQSASVTSALFLVVAGSPGSTSAGTGTVTISSAGTVTAPVTILAQATGTTGSVTVSGAGSMLYASSFVGLGGDGSAGGTGTITITNNGTVSTPLNEFESPTSSINVSGGTLLGSLASLNNGYGSITLTDPSSGSALYLDGLGTSTYSGSISGTGSIVKTGGVQILSGANTFTGKVAVEGGTLNMSSGAASYYEVDNPGALVLGFGVLGTSAINAGPNTTVTLGAPIVSGGYLEGSGTFNIAAVNTIVGTTIENGTTITPAGGTGLRAITNYGTIINPASSVLYWYGGSNAGGNLNVSGTTNLTEWTSTGVVQVNAGGVINDQSGTNMVLGGGSVTYVGSANAPGGSINLSGGESIQLTDGLLVNFGNISGGTVYVNYGGLATGTGNYGGGVVVNPGGTYLPGNYGSGSPAAMLGSPFAMIQPATNGSTTTTVPVTVTAGAQITVNPGSTLTLAGGLNASGQTVTMLGRGTAIVAPFSATSVNVSNGVLQISPSSSVLEIGSLTVGTSSKLDLTSDAADISGSNLASVTALAKLGFANGTWNGTGGIASSTAATDPKHLTAIGIIQNNQSGTALYNSLHQFLNTTPGAGDILAAYTYYGDTNLDGQVNSADYTHIDAGFLSHGTLTGWFNGDFNYDGVINGSDYTLIDNAFNTQGAALLAEIADPNVTIASQIAAASNLPEPSLLLLFALGFAGLSRRRKQTTSCADPLSR